MSSPSLALGLMLTLTMTAAAQTGTLTGRVTNADDNRPLDRAVVRVLLPNGAVIAGATTRSDGTYRLAEVTPGTYQVRISAVGFAPFDAASVTIQAGQSTTLDAALSQQAIRLEEITVTTVSREPEKKTDAPAAVFTVTRTEVEERPGLTVTDHLKNLPGVDISQGGLVQSNVVGRGFNNIFSGALLTLIDYRYAAVPSLRVNVPTFFPLTPEDIETVEFVLGPGAALYGPNASNGVLNILTRSPFTSTGATVSLESGFRSSSRYAAGDMTYTGRAEPIVRATGRFATRIGTKAAIKVSGSYLKSKDWKMRDEAEPASLDVLHPELGIAEGRCNVVTGCRDFNLEQWNGDARLDVRPDANTEVIAGFGMSNALSLIEYTGIGAAQTRGWRYMTGQLRLRWKRFFAQGFGNFSGAGLDNSGATPRARAFLLRDGNPIVDESRVWSGQFQHGFDVWNGKETILYGADYFKTDARTGGTINGSNEDDDTINEYGGYVHSVTRIHPKLDLVAALRVDKHNRLEDAVWSPRAALVFKPMENHAIRATYNRAFSTPSSNNLFLDIVAGQIPLGSSGFSYNVRALGVPSSGGFQFRADGGCAGGTDNLCMRTPFGPLLPPGTPELLPANAAALWRVAVEFVRPQVGNPLANLMSGNAPTTQVGTQLRRLNPTTRQFVDIATDQVVDITPLKPTVNTVFEAGYKGLIGNKLQVSADGWFERKKNFTGPLIVESPTVFLDRTTTIQYLTNLFTAAQIPNAAATAALVGTAMAGLSAATSTATTGIPLGTVVPTNTALTGRPDIFLTYRNFGEVDLYGADLALDFVYNSHLSVSGSYSWVNKDFFPRAEIEGGAPTDVALNATRSKGSVAVAWRDDPRGWSAEVRFRGVKGFPVNSGVYVSAPDPDDPSKLLPTDSYGLFDVQATWRPPVGNRNLLLSVNAQNILDKRYSTFVGVPNLGTVAITKLSYTF
ncbi:MAG TPA: TonB-dependent receptor [Gemmatimonadales bacterium]|nr:TonB-dependent receptor [Gemmatimonadales bacterium]